jgi:hypothetical protein
MIEEEKELAESLDFVEVYKYDEEGNIVATKVY